MVRGGDERVVCRLVFVGGLRNDKEKSDERRGVGVRARAGRAASRRVDCCDGEGENLEGFLDRRCVRRESEPYNTKSDVGYAYFVLCSLSFANPRGERFSL